MRHHAALLALAIAAPASAQFLEPDADALYTVQRPGGFGWAVAELADIDADTVPDAISSAPSASSGRGRVTVFSGATGAILFEFTDTAPGSSMGWAITDAGDINNDGFHDIAAGAPPRVGPLGAQGGVVVLSGNPASYGQVLLTLWGPEANSGFGYALAGMGDVNADGHDDLLVGSPLAGAANPSQGLAFIVSGHDGSIIHTLEGSGASGAGFGRGVAGVGDLDGDGITDAVVAASFEQAAYVFSGATGLPILPPLTADPGATGNFGHFFVGRLGDVSGDGVPDIYIGDFGDSKAYVYSGADGSRWLTIDAPTPQGLGCGRGLNADIDHDGLNELAIGSYTSPDGAPNAGKITIHSGADGRILRTITGTAAGHQLGFDCVGIGDVNADGHPDFLGAAGSGNRVHLILGTDPCPADFTDDYALTADDVTVFVDAFLNADPAADLDASGSLSLDDIEAFVRSYTAGCP